MKQLDFAVLAMGARNGTTAPLEKLSVVGIELAQCLSAHTALAEDLSFVSSTYIARNTTDHSSSGRRSHTSGRYRHLPS